MSPHSRVGQFFAVAGLTAAEALRRPVSLLITLTGVLLTILTPALLFFQFGEESRVTRDSGLSGMLVLGIVFVAHAAFESLGDDLRGGRALSLLSKPLSRTVYLAGKFTGVLAAATVYLLCMTLTLLLAERAAPRGVEAASFAGTDWPVVRHVASAALLALLAGGGLNFLTRRPFPQAALATLALLLSAAFLLACYMSRAGRFIPFAPQVDWRILPASALIGLALLPAAAWAVLCASSLRPAFAAAVYAAVIISGLLSEYAAAVFPQAAGPVLDALLPAWHHFWLTDTLSAGQRISWPYVGLAASYSACYSLAVLTAATWLFRRAEVSS